MTILTNLGEYESKILSLNDYHRVKACTIPNSSARKSPLQNFPTIPIPLFDGHQAIESQGNSGYKSTARSAREITFRRPAETEKAKDERRDADSTSPWSEFAAQLPSCHSDTIVLVDRSTVHHTKPLFRLVIRSIRGENGGKRRLFAYPKHHTKQ